MDGLPDFNVPGPESSPPQDHLSPPRIYFFPAHSALPTQSRAEEEADKQECALMELAGSTIIHPSLPSFLTPKHPF